MQCTNLTMKNSLHHFLPGFGKKFGRRLSLAYSAEILQDHECDLENNFRGIEKRRDFLTQTVFIFAAGIS